MTEEYNKWATELFVSILPDDFSFSDIVKGCRSSGFCPHCETLIFDHTCFCCMTCPICKNFCVDKTPIGVYPYRYTNTKETGWVMNFTNHFERIKND